MRNLLIIDDEKNICISLEFALEDNYNVFTCQDPMEGLKLISEKQIDLILLDLRIGEYNGVEILRRIKEINSNIPVIIMTAYGSIKSSVEAIKSGAFYYITKPIDVDELTILISKALEYLKLNNKVKHLSEKLSDKFGIDGIIGKSKIMVELFSFIDKVKDIDSNVLLIGESGTGKDVVAKAIHYQGRRKDSHLEVINCAAIPTQLLESELFGYVRGAFTGADKDKEGKFQAADGGTIFLDEIGEMELAMQAKMLRVLEDKEITPLGTNIRQKINVRVIAATNKDLEKAIEEGTFREDLYYRLNVIKMELPPLRERKDDIPLLIDYFIGKYNKMLNKSVVGIESTALKLLENYNYKGNVRELENIVERAMVLIDNKQISPDDLPKRVLDYKSNRVKAEDEYIQSDLKTLEKQVILKTLENNNGRKNITAEILGISERTLRNKLKEYNEQK